MRSKVIWSFLSLVAVSTAALVSGCDSDATISKSGVGESCDSSADCEEGLNCLQGACYKTAPAPGGGEGGEPMIGPPDPVLGAEGESCTSRADCEDGLGCFNQRCTAAPTGEGGGGPVGPALGGPGETCGLTSDCADGLACLPQNAEIAPIIKQVGSNSIGVCTPLDSGLQPTGKECGYECETAEDCCELPILQQTVTGARSCAELAVLAGEVANCNTATGTPGAICLAYSVYCDGQCEADTWACEAGACQYTAKCTKAGQVVGGCPGHTRGGTAIPECDTDTDTCTIPVPEPTGCSRDADCEGEFVADSQSTDTCVADECVCHTDSGLCYRACAVDLDCAYGYVCDGATSLCTPQSGCETDLVCIRAYGDIRAKCTEGVCGVPCVNDIDCNPGGLTNGSFERVCGPENTCVNVGCDSNSECGEFPGGGGVRSFCVAPPEGTAVKTVQSAITG